MSSYTEIASVNEIIRHTLWNSFQNDPIVRPIVGSEAAIVFTDPVDAAQHSASRLSIWLYQIAENELIRNQPSHPSNRLPSPPSLNLSYLITPFTPTPEAGHRLLGATMQVLFDNAMLPLRSDPQGITGELRIFFCQQTLEERTQLWLALREPYHLSLAYLVQLTIIAEEEVV